MCIIKSNEALFIRRDDAKPETISALGADYKILEHDVANIKLWVSNGKPYDGVAIVFFPKNDYTKVEVPPLCKPFRSLDQFQMSYPKGVVFEPITT